MGRKKRTKSGGRQPDHLTRQAQAANFPARSVFKLEEIQKKHRILKQGDKVLDLGCSPGSWLLYASKIVGGRGHITGIDKQEVTIEVAANVTILTGDILEPPPELLSDKGLIDTVLSDMAPNTIGNKATDAARSFILAEAALETARLMLKPGGNFVCKIFQGEDFKKFTDMVKGEFDKHKIFKPESCRRESRETYVLGLAKTVS